MRAEYEFFQSDSPNIIGGRISFMAEQGWRLLGPVQAVLGQGPLRFTYFATMFREHPVPEFISNEEPRHDEV